MVTLSIEYNGSLRCTAQHDPSGAVVKTDAPKDNQGLGASFSPTDMVAAGLGSCMLTIMGIEARKHNLAIEGATAVVQKIMTASPPRKIARLEVTITLPSALSEEHLNLMKTAADTCPVSLTLRDTVEIETHWIVP